MVRRARWRAHADAAAAAAVAVVLQPAARGGGRPGVQRLRDLLHHALPRRLHARGPIGHLPLPRSLRCRESLGKDRTGERAEWRHGPGLSPPRARPARRRSPCRTARSAAEGVRRGGRAQAGPLIVSWRPPSWRIVMTTQLAHRGDSRALVAAERPRFPGRAGCRGLRGRAGGRAGRPGRRRTFQKSKLRPLLEGSSL